MLIDATIWLSFWVRMVLWSRLSKLFILLSALAIFLFLPKEISAQVVINEFSSGTNTDWIELYNNGTEPVRLSGLRLRDSSASNKKDLSGELAGGGFHVVNFSNWLNNEGDTVRLLTVTGENEELIEQISYGNAGGLCAPLSGGSIGRFPDGDSKIVRFLNSTQGYSNNDSQEDPCSVPTPILTLTPTVVLSPTATPTPALTPVANDYSNIYISEYVPYPESGNEWIELYNDNDFEVNLNGWYIDDIADGGSLPRIISGTISPKTYKQFYLTNAYLNNDGDDVRLLNGDQKEKDKTSFESSTKGKSWSKDKNKNWCQLDPTPNTSNPDCPAQSDISILFLTPTPIPTKKPTPTPTIALTPSPTQTLVPTGEILGILKEEATPSPEGVVSIPKVLKENRNPISFLPKILIGVGFLFLAISGIFLLFPKIKGYNKKENEETSEIS